MKGIAYIQSQSVLLAIKKQEYIQAKDSNLGFQHINSLSGCFIDILHVRLPKMFP